jgi:hypothetical protein
MLSVTVPETGEERSSSTDISFVTGRIKLFDSRHSVWMKRLVIHQDPQRCWFMRGDSVRY